MGGGDEFNKYFEKGIAARDAGDIPLAKAQLLLAAEALKKLADGSGGALKRSRQERVLKILEAVEDMERGPRKQGAGGTAAKLSAPRDESGRGAEKADDTETVWVPAAVPGMDFSRVAGLDEVKRAARDMIIDPVIYPDLYKKHNLKTGGGIMMYGLPGTGKTTVAKAIAGEAGGKFYNVKCSDIFSKWVGEAERNIRNLFAAARGQERSVILFDDCDAIGGGRGGGADVTGKKVLTELLVQMDGADSDNSNLLLLAATNAPWNIDGALTRTGRFDRFLEIPLPDGRGREFIFKRELKDCAADAGLDFNEIVPLTEGYSGADIVGLCNYAKTLSLNRDKAARSLGRAEDSLITRGDFALALKAVKSSVKKSDRERLERFKRENGLV